MKAVWRPISSAPKDGSPFLTYTPDAAPEYIYDVAGYLVDERCWWKYACGFDQVTHWHPIVPPQGSKPHVELILKRLTAAQKRYLKIAKKGPRCNHYTYPPPNTFKVLRREGLILQGGGLTYVGHEVRKAILEADN